MHTFSANRHTLNASTQLSPLHCRLAMLWPLKGLR
jgi:hypothetical protein